MTRRYLYLAAAWLAIGTSACTTFRPGHTPGLDNAKACADWRWIGISRPGIRCPEIPDWTGKPLFPQLSPAWRKSDDYCKREDSEKGDYCKERSAEKAPDSELIRELNRFCVYEPERPQRFFKQPVLPPAASADLVRFDRDCAALSLADTELAPKDWPSNYETFLSETGRQGTPINFEDGPNVRLVFLDTQPTSVRFPESSGNSAHGYTLANVARNLVCTSEPFSHCAAQITTRLALPIIKFDPRSQRHTEVDLERGGYLGMLSTLAQAIRNEVDTWVEDRRNGRAPQHLVLNLSLAWDAKIAGGLSEEWIHEMQAGTQAVYLALQYAASFDVLVLAAAGNQKCTPCDNYGPLLPAAWEKEGPQEQGCHKPRQKPLLYAVGGVDSDGKPLANARPGGMPRRAAYGETAVVTRVSPGTYETTHSGMIYSGSSVATAVVSSIAAVVWDLFPGYDSHEVMKILDESGNVLPLKANFSFVDPNVRVPVVPDIRRLSLCTALATACQPPGSCPFLPSCVSWEPRQSLERKLRTWSQGSCQPWLFPQPEIPPCMVCGPGGGI